MDGWEPAAGPAGDRCCLAELRELSGSMTTPEMAREVEELRKDCAGYADKLERIKSATNHVTPEEKEKVKRGWAFYQFNLSLS